MDEERGNRIEATGMEIVELWNRGIVELWNRFNEVSECPELASGCIEATGMGSCLIVESCNRVIVELWNC